ncbi:hypothetical protein ANN_08851 [Periplaneta americana]|uniref:Uncharacterized protein n=1 Tax=Periplaneta americana TaxID=6978 RepID=A0ABQ8T427_PERAM|nr:hypothetical protein ANN_08851 [Periplaneta americana]
MDDDACANTFREEYQWTERDQILWRYYNISVNYTGRYLSSTTHLRRHNVNKRERNTAPDRLLDVFKKIKPN